MPGQNRLGPAVFAGVAEFHTVEKRHVFLPGGLLRQHGTKGNASVARLLHGQ